MRRPRPLVLRVASPMALGWLGVGSAWAQAWLPPGGEASFAMGFARSFADDHLFYDGAAVKEGTMEWRSAVTDLGYGITDRWAVRLGLPFVFSKYEGDFPHPPAAPGGRVIDDGTWNGWFTDLRAEVRFKATTGALIVTPMVAIAFPTTDYTAHGHSAPGRHLVEGQVGVSVGRLLDPLLPNAYAQARYRYTVAQKVLGISHNRSDVSMDVGYLVTSSLTLSAQGFWLDTYGGIRIPIDIVLPPPSPTFSHHDQLAKTKYVRLGASAAYSVTGSIDVGVHWYTTLWARSDVNMAGFGVSLSYGFSPSQLIKKSKGPIPAN